MRQFFLTIKTPC